MNQNKKKFFLILIFILLILIFFYKFNSKSIAFVDKSCGHPMLWLHAAYSQERLKFSIDNGYCGVEIDTTFSTNRGLIASYNEPDNLVVPLLEDLISDNLDIKYWWLDIKNLNATNAKKISNLIGDLSNKFNQTTFFIESHNFIGLWFLNTKSEELYKVYWLAKGPYKNNQSHILTPLYFVRSILANIFINPDFISMFHYQLSEKDFIWVGNRQRFVFTVNNIKDYERAAFFGANVILTDNLKLHLKNY